MSTRLVTILALASILASSPSSADHHGKGDHDHGSPAAAAAEMPADVQAMMAAWEAYKTPGDAHALMEPMVGAFRATSQHWMQPGAPPVDNAGRAVNRWILGGRYLEQDFEGAFMGMPFHGRGYTGYDNAVKKYVGAWMDNMGTGIMTSTGSVDEAGKAWTFTATMNDPVTGGEHVFRHVVRIESDDRHVFEMYDTDPENGQEFLNMRVVYTRAEE